MKWYMQFVNINFKNSFTAYHSRDKAMVGDVSQTGLYIRNSYLSNNSNYNSLNEKPALEFSKSISKGLANRYQKTVSFGLLVQGQIYDQQHLSDKDFQRIKQTYTRFIPEASISYRNSQVGHYESVYTLKYAKSMIYATVYQLAPLVDSANVYYLHMGNPDLRPAERHELSLNLDHMLLGVKASGNGTFTINAGVQRNFIGDSSTYDALGRNLHYNVNLAGNKYIGYFGFLHKVYKLKQNQLIMMLQSRMNYAHNPAYVNAQPILSRSLSSYHSVGLDYGYKSWLKFGGGPSLSTYATRQTNSSNTSYRNYGLSANTAVNWPRNCIGVLTSATIKVFPAMPMPLISPFGMPI